MLLKADCPVFIINIITPAEQSWLRVWLYGISHLQKLFVNYCFVEAFTHPNLFVNLMSLC